MVAFGYGLSSAAFRIIPGNCALLDTITAEESTTLEREKEIFKKHNGPR